MMELEIERKFLLAEMPEAALQAPVLPTLQGYLSDALRVRMVLHHPLSEGELLSEAHVKLAELTLKHETGNMLIREESTSLLLPSLALELYRLAGERTVEKLRYLHVVEGVRWEIDVFQGRHAGLIVAEVEGSEAHLLSLTPPFPVVRDITQEAAYRNAALSLLSNLGDTHD
jgi:adenylate cyclase